MQFTTKSQEALAAAQEAAVKAGNPELTPLHLLDALLNEKEGNVRPSLEAIGCNLMQLDRMVDAEMQQLPKMSGNGAMPQPSGEFHRVLYAAEDEAEAMKDEYTSTEHLLLALEKVPSKPKCIETQCVGT